MSRVKMLRFLIPLGVVAMVAVGWAKQSPVQGGSASDAPLKGRVMSADGAPMEGVAISARADDRRTIITTSVYTDQDGRYALPPLAAPLSDGPYKVMAQAVGFEAGRATVRLAAGKGAEQNFTLTPLKDFSRQLSGIEWMASLPESTPQDRRAKRLYGVNCIQCHTTAFALQNRFDATGWSSIVKLMSTISFNGQDPMRDAPDAFINGYKDEIVAYLERVRGPRSEAVFKPLPRVTGESTRIVVTEYEISPGHLPGTVVVDNGNDWSFGPPSHHESRAAHDTVVDLQGNVWFTDNVSPRRSIGKLDPRVGRITDYTQVSEKGEPVNVHDINVDQAGNIWFNNGRDGSLDKFDPKSEKFQNFPLPASLRGVGGLIGVDSKGNIWGRTNSRRIEAFDAKWGLKHQKSDPEQPGGAVKLDPKTGEYTYYKAVKASRAIYSIGVDAEDNAYFTHSNVDRIGYVDARTGKVGEIDISARDKDNVLHTELDAELVSRFEPPTETGPPWQKGPRRQTQSYWLAAKYAKDKKFDSHWFTLSKASAIAKVDIRTKKVTEYPLPHPYSFPYQLTVDKNHMVWVAAMNTDRVFKFNPYTERWTEYPLPSLGSDSRSVDVDNTTDPPTVWMAYWGTNKLARIQFKPTAVTRASR
ncbi:MAG: hypothetical protein A3G20_01935 [Acidobacteria bacterium RIFCSPLOWO2_12_FULL_59_11]|nr:MAG: hypothetical protein A3G20_01935 [Acidobacteria bacterium RIFCSPLOWO2_12_FULL_59_11]